MRSGKNVQLRRKPPFTSIDSSLPLCRSNNSTLPLISPRPLLQDRPLALVQHGLLPLVDALQPVAEAGAHGAEDGVGPETPLEEDGAHLDA
jgi:hypothetical protein